MVLNRLVHQRLGRRRLVGFVVATTAVTYQIDDDVLAKLIAIIHRQHGREHDRIGIVAVDVEYRRLHHLRDIGTVLSRPCIVLSTGGKTDLVIDHHVNGATGLVGAGLGQLEGLHDHALPGKSCIAMQQNGQYLFT